MEKIIGNNKNLPLFALICAFLWGCGYSVVKTGYVLFEIESADVPAKILFAGIRFVLAGMMTFGYCIASKKGDFSSIKRNFGSLMLFSLFQTILQYAFLYIALANLTGSTSSVLNQLGAFLLVLLLPLTDKSERISLFKIIGCIIGFAGLVLVNLDGLRFSFNLPGEGCIILSSCSAAVGYIISRNVSRKVNPILATGCQQLIGGIVLTLAGLVSGGRVRPTGTAAILVLIYLAFSIALAYVIWAVLLKYNPVSEVTVYKFAVPLFGVLVSGLLLGEDIWNLKTAVSLAAVAAGILLVNFRPKKSETEKLR